MKKRCGWCLLAMWLAAMTLAWAQAPAGENYEQLLLRANDLYKEGKLPEALGAVQAAGKLEPERYEAPALAALIFHTASRPAEAQAALAAAQKLAPAGAQGKVQAIAELLAQPAQSPGALATASAKPAFIDPATLTGDVKRRYTMLLLIAEDADKAKLAEERNKLLGEYLERSAEFVKEQSNLLSIWLIRAVAAMELDIPGEGWTAGQQLTRLGANDSPDPKVGKVLAMLERKGWLGLDAPPSQQEIKVVADFDAARKKAGGASAADIEALVEQSFQVAVASQNTPRVWLLRADLALEFNLAQVGWDAAQHLAMLRKERGVDTKIATTLEKLQARRWFDPKLASTPAALELAKFFNASLPEAAGIHLAGLPPGEFEMGGEKPTRDNTYPFMRVQISKPYWLGKTEVTHEQFARIMTADPAIDKWTAEELRDLEKQKRREDDVAKISLSLYHIGLNTLEMQKMLKKITSAQLTEQKAAREKEFREREQKSIEAVIELIKQGPPSRDLLRQARRSILFPAEGEAPDGKQTPEELVLDQHPSVAMYFVSYDDAVEFCAKLTEVARKENKLPAGYVYRLPTIAEWNYACRGNGENSGNLGEFAWTIENAAQAYPAGTRGLVDEIDGTKIYGPRHVGLKQANEVGLYDMLGNLSEWCMDSGLPSANSQEIQIDPYFVDASKRRIALLVGGDIIDKRDAASSHRFGYIPKGLRGRNIGFRVVLAPEGLTPTSTPNTRIVAAEFNEAGHKKIEQKDFSGAVSDFSEALRLDPEIGFYHLNLGLAWYFQNNFSSAIESFSKVIAGNDQDYIPQAYQFRAAANRKLGELDASEADYGKAIQLKPSANAYNARGALRYNRGLLPEALADFRSSIALDETGKSGKYSRLLAWVVQTKLKQKSQAANELKAYLSQHKSTPANDWPSRLLNFLVGRISEKELLAAARNTDKKTESGQLCEAYFYAGQKRLADGNKTLAAEYFEKSRATGRTEYYEYEMAGKELEGLKTTATK